MCDIFGIFVRLQKENVSDRYKICSSITVIISFLIKCGMVLHVSSVVALSIALFICFMYVIKQLQGQT